MCKMEIKEQENYLSMLFRKQFLISEVVESDRKWLDGLQCGEQIDCPFSIFSLFPLYYPFENVFKILFLNPHLSYTLFQMWGFYKKKCKMFFAFSPVSLTDEHPSIVISKFFWHYRRTTKTKIKVYLVFNVWYRQSFFFSYRSLTGTFMYLANFREKFQRKSRGEWGSCFPL